MPSPRIAALSLFALTLVATASAAADDAPRCGERFEALDDVDTWSPRCIGATDDGTRVACLYRNWISHGFEERSVVVFSGTERAARYVLVYDGGGREYEDVLEQPEPPPERMWTATELAGDLVEAGLCADLSDPELLVDGKPAEIGGYTLELSVETEVDAGESTSFFEVFAECDAERRRIAGGVGGRVWVQRLPVAGRLAVLAEATYGMEGFLQSEWVVSIVEPCAE